MMRILTNLAAAPVAAVVALALHGGPTTAAPLSQPLAARSVDTETVELVQYRYRRWNRGGRWIGPARGYYRGYYGRRPWWTLTPQYGSCTGDRDTDSVYPSWACR